MECHYNKRTRKSHIHLKTHGNHSGSLFLFSYYLGSYPIAINLGVSPPGNHEVTITVKDDEGLAARDTVSYFLGSDSIPTGYIV